MDISMKDTLRRLRFEKGVTQETLANHLGISQQSVGKWERGEGYPDITLLPKIALFFGVTIDELLNFSRTAVDEAVAKYEAESQRYCNIGDIESDLALWERAYAEFPNDCRVISGLMYALLTAATTNPESGNERRERVVSLGERILDESKDEALRGGAIQALCFAYNRMGNTEKALFYADMGGGIYSVSPLLRISVLTGERGTTETQRYIMDMIDCISNTAAYTVHSKNSPKEIITSTEFAVNLLKLLFPNGDYGFYLCRMASFYERIAENKALLSLYDEALEALAAAMRYAKAYDRQEDMRYTSPMVDRLEYKKAETSKNTTNTASEDLLESICAKTNKAYDAIRDDERFSAIVSELERIAAAGKM
ncbi:MAG: helix-turn-helix transcriptional regulator [Clostridia bacterium]|nr:helix-turn-helix transcriptional regulator [Clostridia bacterium]